MHPEDNETDVDDLTIVTLSRTIARNIYNDLGFLVGNRLMVLVEAQSTWSENILVRFLMYLGETYRRYLKTNGFRLYNEKILSEWKDAMLMTGCTTLGDITPDKIRLTN